MARLFIVLFFLLALVALAALAMSAMVRAVRDAGSVGRDVALTTRGTKVQKIAYAALLILMLGVTGGLLGGM